MAKLNYDTLIRETGKSVVLAKIESAMMELTGGTLIALLRSGEDLFELQLSGRNVVLPTFCEIYRKTPEGRKRCFTCRSLMTFGACHREWIDYSCHGGVSIIAAAAPSVLGDGARPVVASCAFAMENRREGWQQSRNHARNTGVDLKDLRRAYNQLPQLTEERRQATRVLVDIAASALGDLVNRLAHDRRKVSHSDAWTPSMPDRRNVEHIIGASLYISNDNDSAPVETSSGKSLVQRVIDMVTRSPEMAFNVSNIARAARISPNYFSTLFKEHTEQTFSDFMTEKRLELAKNLLRDLTLNVNEIATRAGFRDCSYFIRRFREKIGMTPLEWRNTTKP